MQTLQQKFMAYIKEMIVKEWDIRHGRDGT